MSARHAAAPVSTERPIRRFRHQDRPGPGFAVGPSGRRLERDRRTARQSAGEPKRRGLGVSRGAGDLVAEYVLALALGRLQLAHLAALVLGGGRDARIAVNHSFILHQKSASKKPNLIKAVAVMQISSVSNINYDRSHCSRYCPYACA
jgi:hypothetical protein